MAAATLFVPAVTEGTAPGSATEAVDRADDTVPRPRPWQPGEPVRWPLVRHAGHEVVSVFSSWPALLYGRHDLGSVDVARTVTSPPPSKDPRAVLPRLLLPLVGLSLVVLVSACTRGAPAGPDAEVTSAPSPSASPDPTGTTSPSASPVPRPSATAAPAWLGSRVLEPGPTGFPRPEPTPEELLPRSIVTEDVLPPPPDDGFHVAVGPVGQDLADRSTWHPGCPVALEDLRHVTVSHWGFDGEHHTGEVLLHADAVDAVVAMFEAMHQERFPLEQVAIITPTLLDAPATGDGNITSAFVCRQTRGSSAWSAHASGRALDINPFHNPYDRQDDDGRVVLPELATAYTDRSLGLPGMLTADSPLVEVIEAVGWHWGGAYTTLSDPMHVSATGR